VRLTRQKKAGSPVTLNMAAMVDIVFQLNIFFILTSSAVTMEKELQTQMPSVNPSATQASEFNPIRLRLSRAGAGGERPPRPGGPGGVLVLCDATPVESFEALVAMLKARRAQADVPVIIEGQETVPYGQMVAALDACYRADLRKVAFSARGAP
jgi:biopolymer transport protein ExbD